MIDSMFYFKITRAPDSLNVTYDQEYYPIISQEDIDKGFLMRYFVRQTNHDTKSPIREISEGSNKKIQNSTLYETIEVPWIIRGVKQEVAAANEISVIEAENVFSGVKYRLTNYLQFYKGL